MLLDKPPAEIEIPHWVYDCIEDTTKLRDFHITKGLGSGGTYGGAIWYIHRCLYANKKSQSSWVIAPTYAQIIDPVIVTVCEVLETVYKIKNYKLVKSGFPHIVFPNGHIGYFKSARSPEHLVGANISHAWFTEAGLIPSIAFEKTTARVRDGKAGALQKLFEGTPEGICDWANLADFDTGLDEAKNKVRIILKTKHNKYLPEGYLDKLIEAYQHDENRLIAYTEGLFRPFTKGTAYWDFREHRHVIDPVAPLIHSPLNFCWDFNVYPLAWTCFQSYISESFGFRKQEYIQHGESTGDSKGIMDALVEFIKMYPPELYRNTEIHVYGDRSGHSGSHKVDDSDYKRIMRFLRERYRSVSLKAAEVNPRVKDRLQQHNLLFSYDRYKITSNCKKTIRSYQLTKMKEGTWDIEKDAKDDFTHWGDAAGYGLFELTQNENFEKPNHKKLIGINRS